MAIKKDTILEKMKYNVCVSALKGTQMISAVLERWDLLFIDNISAVPLKYKVYESWYDKS